MREVDLSLPLTQYLKSLGYCVHGEVSIFDRTRTIDHVAHTGPCDAPEYVVLFDMKLAFNQDLVDQLSWADVGHYGDAHFFVTPQKRGYDCQHKLWLNVSNQRKWYLQPGWITLDGDNLEILADCVVKDKRYHRRNAYRLLLTDHNKDSLAGFRSGGIDVDTHWKAGVRYVQAKQQNQEVSLNELLEGCPAFFNAYKQPRNALRRIQQHLRMGQKPRGKKR